jgi:hypothetical protein
MRKFLFVLCALSLAACDSGTGSSSVVTGKWLYRLEDPVAGCDFEGIVLLNQSGSVVSGTFPAPRSDCAPSSELERLPFEAGGTSVSGNVAGSDVGIVFTDGGAEIESSGSMRGDSISGTAVVDLGDGSGPRTVSFGMRRYNSQVLAGRSRFQIQGSVSGAAEGWARASGPTLRFGDDLGAATIQMTVPGTTINQQTYPAGDGANEAQGSLVVRLTNGTTRGYIINGGEIEVTQATATGVRGRVNLTGVLSTDIRQGVQVIGEFWASR